MLFCGRVVAPLLLCTLGLASALPAHASTSDQPSMSALRQMIARDFTDLNAHRYHAAWLLEVPCRVTFAIANGPGGPPGSESYAGRGAWVPSRGPASRHPILASVRVTGIKRLHIPILARHHILAFGVSGWYRFDYSAVPWANDTHTSGFHVVKIAAWQCHGRWGLEPSYWVSSGGGELSWK